MIEKLVATYLHDLAIDFLHKTFYHNVDMERWAGNVSADDYVTSPFA